MLLIALALAGCGGLGGTRPQPVDAFAKAHEAKAQARIDQGDLHGALVHWRVLLALHPANTRYQHQVAELTRAAESQAAVHLGLAKKALSRGDTVRARREFLRVLALRPGHSLARKHLQRLERDQVMAVQMAHLEALKRRQLAQAEADQEQPAAQPKAAKTAEPATKEDTTPPSQDLFYLQMGEALLKQGKFEAGIREVNNYLASNPSDQRARKLVIDAHLTLARRLEQSNKKEQALPHFVSALSLQPRPDSDLEDFVAKLRHELAERRYREGLKQFRRDIDLAIQHLEKAVELDPSHTNAQIKLKAAEHMRRNLRGIADSDS